MITIDNLAVRQGNFSLTGVSFEVPTGRYAVLMGKSGCGKTSLLEAIAGLRPTRSGRIVLGGRDVTHLRPSARQIGYVPQDGALFPTQTVRDNLAFALEIRRATAADIEKRVADLASWLELTALLDRKPSFLSGGEKQRVALGRALAFRPPILLLDEPLSSLDDETRAQLLELLVRLRDSHAVTVLHITHSRAEADQLGEVVFRLDNGVVRQIGPGGV